MFSAEFNRTTVYSILTGETVAELGLQMDITPSPIKQSEWLTSEFHFTRCGALPCLDHTQTNPTPVTRA